MAKKDRISYVCAGCGAVYSAWSGKCVQCGEWNTINEQLDAVKALADKSNATALEPINIAEAVKTSQPVVPTGMAELDTVLGGGIVGGSINLIAGQPGIGKSTLLMQIADKLASNGHKVLYVSGEESAHQVSLRAARLGVMHKNIDLVATNSSDAIAATILRGSYRLVIVDSIQTMSCADVASAAGSVSQITNSAHLITLSAKRSNTAVILVGHVTKEGSIAGPKILEHLVDVVLQLDGERYGGFKIIRAVKNRYGPTDETAIYEMHEVGLRPVDNPSAALLDERQVSDGSVVLATMEGTRPILVEVQALVNATNYGYPKRAASGIDLNRMNLLVAMLERRTKLRLSDKDIYVNIVGGLRVTEPAADLAVCMAIASAAKGMQLKTDAVVFGELGLSGEVRRVQYAQKRIMEADKLGFVGAIGPPMEKLSESGKYYEVRNIRDALNKFLSKDN